MSGWAAAKPPDCSSKSLCSLLCLLVIAQHLSNSHPALRLQVLCMHGGIGRSINSIEQIEELQRPLTMEDGGIVLMDLLWRWAQWHIHWMMLVEAHVQVRMLAHARRRWAVCMTLSCLAAQRPPLAATPPPMTRWRVCSPRRAGPAWSPLAPTESWSSAG